MSLNVVDFPQSAVHTAKALAQALRNLADEVESGQVPDLARIHVLFEHENETLSYAMIGKSCGSMHKLGVFTYAGAVLSEQMD